jgi:hypothetical protein
MQGDWLNEIGFKFGKLAAAEYGQGQIILRLQDSGNYKELVKGALKTSSGLFQVRRETSNGGKFSRLDIWGFRLPQFGFTIGSIVIARYEYGFIKLSLVDLDQLEQYQGTALMERTAGVVTRARTSVPNKYRPKIMLIGNWLDKKGFTPGKLVAVESAFGQISLRLKDSDDCQVLKGAPKASLGLLRVKQATIGKKPFPQIEMKGLWLEKFGFTIGKAFTAGYEYGLIKLSFIEKEVPAWKQEYLR